MDLVRPEVDGITAAHLIGQELPETEVVALTSVLEGGVGGPRQPRGRSASR